MQHSSRKPPYFTFPDIPPFETFTFEKLSLANFEQLYLLFKDDDSPFTDERFKHYETAQQYAGDLEEYGASSPKHGGQDWFFKQGDVYLGILHLYDLSLETFAENNKRCWIGFAIKPSMRRKGITRKMVHYFIHYIFSFYPLIDYIHAMTWKENEPSQAFLLSAGFQYDAAERLSDKYSFYVLLRKEIEGLKD